MALEAAAALDAFFLDNFFLDNFLDNFLPALPTAIPNPENKKLKAPNCRNFMSLGATRTHFRIHAPRGFFVHNDKAYAFNAYHAPLGTVRAKLPTKNERDGAADPDIYVYNDTCAPWLSSAARVQYFERLAAVETHFTEVLWFWDSGDVDCTEFFTKKPSMVILKQAEKLT